MALNLSRNTRLWISTAEAGSESATNTFEVAIQDGYSFSAQPNTSDITVNEAGATPTRGSQRFNDSMNPVDWSFATYIRPYTASTPNRCLLADKVLWHALATNVAHDAEWDDNTKPVHGVGNTGTSFDVSFESNSVHELAKLRMIFKVDNVYTIIENCQVGQAEISVDIDGIGMTTWTGQGTSFSTTETAPAFIASNDFEAKVSRSAGKYLRNKLSTLSLVASSDNSLAPVASRSYDIAITGATITLSNNITYLTPETLGEVDIPIGSFTGTFDVSGSLQCYLDTKSNGSAQLLRDMQSFTSTRNRFSIKLNMGGPTGERLELTLPTAHIGIPDVAIEDVVSTSLEFKGLPSSPNMNDGDEISISAFAA